MRQHYPIPPADAIEHQQDYAKTETFDLWLFDAAHTTGALPSVKARKLDADIERAARNAHLDVLITGETGTSKTFSARQIHDRSRRAGRPFKDLNCANLPEHLFEAELFGYKKGAFTGADRDHAGLFEDADGGTLFLDEIGEIPISLQNKLLKAIEEKRIKRLGATQYIDCNIRIIAATARNLEKMVEAGSFREDLYCRLSVLQIQTVPLRERREDIPVLLDHFLREAARLSERNELFTIESGAVDLIYAFDFPGNIRRLRNMVYELTSYVTGDVSITAEDVRQYLARSASECDTSSRAHQVFPRKGDIVVPVDICIIRDGETLKQWEMRVRKRAIEAARQTEGHMPAAARRLGVAHSTLKQHLRLASQRAES